MTYDPHAGDWDKPAPPEDVFNRGGGAKVPAARPVRTVLAAPRMPEVKFKPPLRAARHRRAERDVTIESPAMGDAYSFHIRVRCSWCVQATASGREGGDDRRIRDFIAKSRGVTRERLEEQIRPIARKFPPYRAAEAEEVSTGDRRLLTTAPSG